MNQTGNHRRRLFAELCSNHLCYLLDAPLPVHLTPGVAAKLVQQNMTDAGPVKKFLRKPIVEPTVYDMDGDNAGRVSVPGVSRIADRDIRSEERRVGKEC